MAEAHNDVHLAIVRAAASERIARAYEALAGEMQLFLMALRPHWSLERMAAQHEELLERLERADRWRCATICAPGRSRSWPEKVTSWRRW